jgi:hypothetical protein
MDTIGYGDLRIELLGARGSQVRRTLVPATPVLQLLTKRRAAFDPAALPGRDAEIAAVEGIAAGDRIEFHATCGSGKTTLLRHLADRLGHRATVPVVYLRAGGHRPDDLRRSLVEALYAAGGTANATLVQPTPQQRGDLLRQARAMVLLDDVSLGPQELRGVLAEIPQCGVIIGCTRPIVGRIGRSVPLTGLASDTALEVIRNNLGRDLTDRERSEAVRLCTAIDGAPLHLRQAAALVRTGQHTFAELARAAEDDVFALDRLSLDALTGPQRRALALLAFAAGALLPTDLVGAVTDIADTWEVLTSLRRRGLAEQQQDRFGLPVCHADDYRSLLLRHLALGDAARVIAEWIARQGPGSRDARAAASAALTIIGYAAERADWPAVVRLVEAVEPILELAGRWDAWGDALTYGLAATRLVGDLAAQGQMEHQLGVHAYIAGDVDRAREYWESALRLRERAGDVEGAAVTRANLALFPVAPPPHARRTWRLGISKSAWATVAGLVVLAVTIPTAIGASRSSPPLTDPSGSPTGTYRPGTGAPGPGSAGTGNTPPGDGVSGGGSSGGRSGGGTSGGGTSGGGTSGGGTSGGGGQQGHGGNTKIVARASASASVSPASYIGSTCPHVFTFSGVIQVSSGPITVRYRWVRSDGAAAPAESVSFTGNGPQKQVVTTTWTLSANGTHWEALQILSPNTAQSDHASFTLGCQPPG